MKKVIEEKIFDKLTLKNNEGKNKEWFIKVSNYGSYSIMYYSYGVESGKKVECSQTISLGKNIGKKNETSHYEQALLEAQSKWNNKRDHGYTNKNIKELDIYFPMLANEFHKHKSKLQFPCYTQPKLDGYRMIYNSSKKTCNSRQGKEFEIIKQTDLYKSLNAIEPDIILDGELYLHGELFENLGVLRKKQLNNQDLIKLNKIEYHVYDIILENTSFEKRHILLNNIYTKYKDVLKNVHFVTTVLANNHDELNDIHLNNINLKFEGTMVRNKNGLYKCKNRSSDLLKLKDFQDNEYSIVDYTCEKDTSGKNESLIIWTCKTPEGNLFNVRPQGSADERKMLYRKCEENFSIFKNRKLWTKFFELTDKKTPRFPTTKTNSYTSYIRDTIL